MSSSSTTDLSLFGWRDDRTAMQSLNQLNVILASSSPRRRQLLQLVGIDHDVIPSDIDETIRNGELPEQYAERLSREKVEHELIRQFLHVTFPDGTTVNCGNSRRGWNPSRSFDSTSSCPNMERSAFPSSGRAGYRAKSDADRRHRACQLQGRRS